VITQHLKKSPLHLAVLLGIGAASAALPSYAQDESSKSEEMERIEIKNSYTTRVMNYSTGLNLSLRETPQSMTVITQQQIDDLAITEIAQALRYTTGINVNRAETDRIFPTARGFSIDNVQFDGANVRGAYGGVEGDFLSDMAVYERVEVIRGAAGLLQGAGNPSAAINLIRKKPTEELRSSINVKAGRWDLTRTEADISSSLGFDDKLRGRFVGAYQDSGSYINSVERDKTVLYGILEADLTPYTQANFGIDYQKHHADGISYGEPVPMYYDDGTRTDLPRSSNTGSDWTYRDRNRNITFASLEHRFANFWQFDFYASHIDGHYDDKRMYVTGFLEQDTGLGLGASPSSTTGDWNQYTLDFRLSGPFELLGRQHQMVIGWNSNLEENDRSRRPALSAIEPWSFYEWDSVPEPEFASESDYIWGWETKQSGFYSGAQFDLAEPLSLIVGLRTSSWSHEEYNYTPEAMSSPVTAVDESDSGVITPYAGIVYDINDHFSTYASMTDIYNIQTQKDRYGNLLDPVHGENYEIGLKGEFFNQRLNFSTAVFQVKQRNVAVPDIEVIVAGQPEQRYKAEDGVETKGYEAELSGELMTGLQVYAGYTHRVARNNDGEKVSRQAPEDMVRITSSYSFAENLPELTLGGGLRWQSEVFPSRNQGVGPNGEIPRQESYTVADLFARYQISDSLTASLNINNLFDKNYFESVGVYNYGSYGEPRNISASVRWDF
jgi:outer membrane receptor for ferric coprogen and ferric-rhodotorulic acid|tara:strand:+ start:26166 stop:28337 length:2172 start_codon:yes stop_codon:yes gene_type:complete